MGVDLEDMPPNGPLIEDIEDSNLIWGDNPIWPEHPLQIRIDEVPTEQVEIRNVYAASVEYIGEISPPNPVFCRSEAKSINDAQVKIEDLMRQAEDARKKMIQPGQGFGGEGFNIWRDIYENIINIELPNARSRSYYAKFMYGHCKKRLSDFGANPDHGGGVLGRGLYFGLGNTFPSSSDNNTSILRRHKSTNQRQQPTS